MKIDNWKKRLAVVICILLGIGIVGNVLHHFGIDRTPDLVADNSETQATEPAQPLVWRDPISYSAQSVHTLKINWVAGNVTLETGDVDQILVRETEAKKEMECVEREGELLIRYSKDTFTSMLGMHSKNGKSLSVVVPEDWVDQNLDLEIVSANVTLKGLKLREAEHDGVSGALTLENCQVQDLDVQTVSGNIQIQGSLDRLECEGVSANCRITADNVPSELKLSGVSGSLEVNLPGQAGFTAELDGVTSQLNTDFEVTKEGDVYTAGDGSCRIHIEGIAGELNIHKAK